MPLQDAIESWARENRHNLEDGDLAIARLTWARIRRSDAGELEIADLTAVEREQIMALFGKDDRVAVAETLNSVRLWARSQESRSASASGRGDPSASPSPGSAAESDGSSRERIAERRARARRQKNDDKTPERRTEERRVLDEPVPGDAGLMKSADASVERAAVRNVDQDPELDKGFNAVPSEGRLFDDSPEFGGAPFDDLPPSSEHDVPHARSGDVAVPSLFEALRASATPNQRPEKMGPANRSKNGGTPPGAMAESATSAQHGDAFEANEAAVELAGDDTNEAAVELAGAMGEDVAVDLDSPDRAETDNDADESDYDGAFGRDDEDDSDADESDYDGAAGRDDEDDSDDDEDDSDDDEDDSDDDGDAADDDSDPDGDDDYDDDSAPDDDDEYYDDDDDEYYDDDDDADDDDYADDDDSDDDDEYYDAEDESDDDDDDDDDDDSDPDDDEYYDDDDADHDSDPDDDDDDEYYDAEDESDDDDDDSDPDDDDDEYYDAEDESDDDDDDSDPDDDEYDDHDSGPADDDDADDDDDDDDADDDDDDDDRYVADDDDDYADDDRDGAATFRQATAVAARKGLTKRSSSAEMWAPNPGSGTQSDQRGSADRYLNREGFRRSRPQRPQPTPTPTPLTRPARWALSTEALSDDASGHAGLSDPVLVAIVALSAFIAGFADGAPTGTAVWDWLLHAVIAGLVVVAASKSPDWLVVAVATVAAALIGQSLWLFSAGLGLLVAVTAIVVPEQGQIPQHRLLRAAAAGLAAQALFRLPAFGFFGLPSLIAGAAILIVLVAGYRACAPSTRRLANRVVAATAAVVAVVVAIGGIVMLGARNDVELGITSARAGLSAARGGEPEAVVASLEDAAAALDSAHTRTDSVWTQPLRLIPVAAQHRQAIVTATRQGSAIAQQASRATIEADISSITMSAGSVDLTALTAMEPDLVRTADLLGEGIRELQQTQSPWLVPQVATRMTDLTDEMRSVLPDARLAAEAAGVIPGMLGTNGPRRYFVAFGSPAESRELGGYVGSWALLEFDGGVVRQVEAGRVSDLYDLSRSNAPLGPLGYPDWYIYSAVPEYWPQNITSSPDLLTVANASRDLFDGLGGAPIDGFVYIDGFALADMLNITGPIQLEGLDTQLSTGNARDFFFDEQYRIEDRDDVKAEMSGIFAAVFSGILDTQLPGPERLGQVLGPAARQGRLQVVTFDNDENAFLRSVKLQRVFDLPRNQADAFALVQANGTASKLDLYLQRNVEYSVVVEADGQLQATASVELSSDVPADAPAYALGTNTPGRSLVYLSLYTPHALTSVRIDDQVVEFTSINEFRYQRYQVEVWLEANAVRRVEFDLDGQIDLDLGYELAVWHQPLVNDDAVRVTYTGPDGTFSESFALVEDTVVDFSQ